MRSRTRGQKTRSLKEIYEQRDEELDIKSNFALLSYQPINFEEAIKDDARTQAMDDDIDAIAKTKTWELVDLPKGKDCIGVKLIYKKK